MIITSNSLVEPGVSWFSFLQNRLQGKLLNWKPFKMQEGKQVKHKQLTGRN